MDLCKRKKRYMSNMHGQVGTLGKVQYALHALKFGRLCQLPKNNARARFIFGTYFEISYVMDSTVRMASRMY
jgi:hypothetical protein